MKKSWIILVGLFTLLIMISLISGVRVNEVMVNPNQCSNNCEYIEIYSNSTQNLTNWIINTTNQDTNFNFYLENYLIITKNKTSFTQVWTEVNESKIIEWKNMGLLNTGESVFLFNNNSELVDNFTYSDTTAGISWQYCSGNWFERNPTPGLSNNCTAEQGDNGNTGDEEEPEIYLEMDWNEDDIINGEEFEIKLKAYNLESENYDIKLYIKFEDKNTVISEIYDEEEDDWGSGSYYIVEIISGSGDESEKFKLRIKDKYDDFEGDAKIIAKIRESSSSSIIDEIEKDIEILEKKGGNEDEEVPKVLESIQTAPITGSVIKLGASEVSTETEDIKTQDNIVYESKTELIKKYAIYGFALLCVGICILLGFKKLK